LVPSGSQETRHAESQGKENPVDQRSSILILLTAVLVTSPLLAPTATAGSPERTIHVPPGWEGAYEFGYAPVVRVGDRVIVSGIPAGGDGSYEDKIRRMYQHAADLLEAAGAGFDDVVEITTFHALPDGSAAFREEFQRYMPVHREFFGDHRPAWTAVGTTALLSPSAVVEMRLVAVVGSGENSRVVRGAAEAPAEEAGEGETKTPEAEGGTQTPRP
jgi:enamine deaminase RidA (YjgF/YER057c/UK114 family)